MRSHDVAEQFPETVEKLDQYDVVILSDVGANTLLLHPSVFSQGQRFPNRLKVLRERVRGQLPRHPDRGDPARRHPPVRRRVETPEGAEGELTEVSHPVTDSLDQTWPALLGYQKLIPKADAVVLANIEDRPLLAVRSEGAGRALAFASNIAPHWAPEEFMNWDGYAHLFSNAVRWLTAEL